MNIKIIFTSAAALAMVAGTPAFAAKGNQNDQAPAAAAADGGQHGAKKNKGKLCRTFDTTESRMGRTRLCLTPAEWKKFDDEQG